MSKLTPDDVSWLESRLKGVAHPIRPRQEFIDRARDELMKLKMDPPRRVRTSVLVAVICSTIGLIAALLLLRRRSI
jgi:hypothetical protein